jgi:hypothetical protein
VVHHVTGGTIPSYIGTDQLRDSRIRGDTLSIGTGGLRSCRRLIRVRQALAHERGIGQRAAGSQYLDAAMQRTRRLKCPQQKQT